MPDAIDSERSASGLNLVLHRRLVFAEAVAEHATAWRFLLTDRDSDVAGPEDLAVTREVHDVANRSWAEVETSRRQPSKS